MNVPKNDDDLKLIYQQIYRELPFYGTLRPRHGPAIQWILSNFPVGTTIFDAGCGRGGLVQLFCALGYPAQGCELYVGHIGKMYTKDGLTETPVFEMAYSDLGKLETNSFDVMVSTDVLEHLLSTTEAFEAIAHLARIASKAVAISVSNSQANLWRQLQAPVFDGDIHLLKLPLAEWREEIEKHVLLAREPLKTTMNSWWFFGWPK